MYACTGEPVPLTGKECGEAGLCPSALRFLWYPVWLEREVPWASSGYFLDFPSHLLVTLRSPYWDIKMALGVAGFIFDRSWPARIVVVVLTGLAVAGIRWRPAGPESKSTQATVRLWLAAMLCCGIAIYIYACVVRLGGPREWYLQAPGFLTLAAAALAVSIRPKRWRPSRILLGAQIVLFVATIPGFVANSWLPLNRAGVARDALQMIGPGALGVFNAGIYGWGARGIVNLDGLVNEDGYKAIRGRNLAGYLRQSPITHILDVDDAKKIRSIISHVSTRPSPGLTVIREWPDQNGFRHRLYRLDWPD